MEGEPCVAGFHAIVCYLGGCLYDCFKGCMWVAFSNKPERTSSPR